MATKTSGRAEWKEHNENSMTDWTLSRQRNGQWRMKKSMTRFLGNGHAGEVVEVEMLSDQEAFNQLLKWRVSEDEIARVKSLREFCAAEMED
jgi:hypothetical protein